MKSRTSFFNATVLGKDITRFAPVWGLYTVFLLLMMTDFGVALQDRVLSVQYFMESLGSINLIYGGLCALFLFGDLFSTRLCNALHAMPLRREGWFLTHTVSGLLFCLVPSLLYCGISMALLQEYFYISLLWLAVNILQFLFFFGLGTFSALCAGNYLGMGAVYLLVNFLSFLADGFVTTVYQPLLPSVRLEIPALEMLCPAMFFNNRYLWLENSENRILFRGCEPETWRYLAIVAGIGVALWLAALLLYRKRHLENAGNLLSWKAARPVFLVVYTLVAELCVFTVTEIPLVGLLVGWVTGQMLIHRTLRVFRWRKLWPGLVLTGLYIASIVLTWIDPMGITRYVPEQSMVAYMYCYNGYSDANNGIGITDPQQQAQILQLHRQLIGTEHSYQYGGLTHVTFTYTLQGGSTVTRQYDVPVASPQGQQLETMFSSWQFLFGTEDWENYMSNVVLITVEDEKALADSGNIRQYTLTDPNQLSSLLAAVKADCDAGTMAQGWEFHRDKENIRGYLNLHTAGPGESHISLMVYADNQNICAFLNSLVP